ncbi:MAG: biotin synthase BioB [Clostridiales bacterium]|nr:biotin synthase BioB [Clostridiales bacterium]
MEINTERLAEEIIKGRRLKAEDGLISLFEADLDGLCSGADKIRRFLCGSRADLCSIINGRGGKCSENCKFCAQSSHYKTACEEYGFLDTGTFLEGCKEAYDKGVNRFSIVTAGRTLSGDDLKKAVCAYSAMHEKYPDITLCASHGLMEKKDLQRIRNCGVTMYHANLETSERFFPQICTTHTYEDKIREIRLAKDAGFEICSGGIFGMGETRQDRIDMALLLSELEIASIPMNFLIPIPGTPLENTERLSQEEIVRTAAVFRYINPTAYIRIAAGRSYFNDGGEILFRSGANAALTGDMLTTVGNNTSQDRAMLKNLGYSIKDCPQKTTEKEVK